MPKSTATALCLFLILAFPIFLKAQSLRSSIGAPYIGLTAYSTQQKDPFSFTSNQAALAQIKTAGIGIYGERRFLLAENSVYAIAAATPTRLGNFGVVVNYAGFQNFSEQKIGLGYGKSLGNKIDVGIQFNYYGYKIPSYQNATTVNFEGGVIIHFSEKLNAGVHVYSPVGGALGKTGEEKIASIYKFGLGYDASENFFVSAEIIKEEDQPVNVTGGFQYRFEKQFFARAGFKTDNTTGFAGIGFLYDNLRIDVAASYHQQLGISPAIVLIYNLKNKK